MFSWSAPHVLRAGVGKALKLCHQLCAMSELKLLAELRHVHFGFSMSKFFVPGDRVQCLATHWDFSEDDDDSDCDKFSGLH